MEAFKLPGEPQTGESRVVIAHEILSRVPFVARWCFLGVIILVGGRDLNSVNVAYRVGNPVFPDVTPRLGHEISQLPPIQHIRRRINNYRMQGKLKKLHQCNKRVSEKANA